MEGGVGELLAWVKLVLEQVGVWNTLMAVMQLSMVIIATTLVFRVLGGRGN